jgi:hypothetical protein
MGFVAVLQEQRTPIALYRNGNRALGSKVGFLLVLLATPPILFGSVGIYNAQNS